MSATTQSKIVPFERAAVPTQSDTVNETNFFRGLFVGTAGNVKFTTLGDQDVTAKVVAGSTIPFQIKRVWSTGTTASDMLGGW